MPPPEAVRDALLGLSLLVGLILAALGFALVRMVSVVRASRSFMRENRSERAFLSAALGEAIGKLRAQERATAARAQASERLSSEIVTSLTSGLMVVDDRGRIQILNPTAQRILGIPPGSVGDTAENRLVGAPALAALIKDGLRDPFPLARRTIEAEGANGPVHLGVSVSPIQTDAGEPHSIVCLFADLTSVIALEQQLQLKDALARLGELTAGLAHEFRNGLATIHGYARLLDPETLPTTQRTYVQGIREETRSMGELVTNFLNFARPEPLTLVPVSLDDVLTKVVDELPEPRAVQIAGTLGVIHGDDVLLRRAFGNLLRNAIEACQTIGHEPRVEVRGERSEGEGLVRVTVRDDGPGFTPTTLARLFQPFFTTKDAGVGLGLAIVQKVIVSHNGQVVARNHPRGGAEFRLTLPIGSDE